jgi:hypothetical protein
MPTGVRGNAAEEWLPRSVAAKRLDAREWLAKEIPAIAPTGKDRVPETTNGEA